MARALHVRPGRRRGADAVPVTGQVPVRPCVRGKTGLRWGVGVRRGFMDGDEGRAGACHLPDFFACRPSRLAELVRKLSTSL